MAARTTEPLRALCSILSAVLVLSLASGKPAGPTKKYRTYVTPRGVKTPSPSIIRLRSSLNITGPATLLWSSNGHHLEVRLTAGGTYPGQGGFPFQTFNPRVNKGVSVQLYKSVDGKTYSHALMLKGAWTPVAQGKYLFRGTTVVPDAAKCNIAEAPSKFLLLLSVPPYPRLSDYVYVSSGVLAAV